MKYRSTFFRGIAPKIDASQLEANQAQTAENVRLLGGVLSPWFNESDLMALVNTGTVRTIFLYEDSHWLEWMADVDIVLGPVSGDTAGKFYFTGAGIPKKSDRTQATTGTGPKPINFYPLGMPVPVDPLTAVNGGGGSGDDRNVQYLWTVISGWNEEGPPSPALDSPLLAKQGATVNLSNITMIWKAGQEYQTGHWVYPTTSEGGTCVYKCVQAGASAGVEPTWGTAVGENTSDGTVIWRCYKNNLSYKRIYRYNTGEQFGGYQRVADIAVSQTTYADTKLDTQLGERLPDIDNSPPPDTLAGLVYLGNGILLGFSGKDLYASKAYQPWAWPSEYIRSLPAAIVAVQVIGETALVLTEQGPFLVTGSDPSTLTPIPLPMKVACVSKRGAVSHGTLAVFPGPDGLYLYKGGEIACLTINHFDYKQWQEIYPATFTAAIYENRYWAFYSYGDSYGALLIDLLTGEPTTLDIYSDAFYVDAKSGRAHYVKDVTAEMHVFRWEGDTTQALKNYTWKSKQFIVPKNITLTCGRIVFESADRTAYFAELAAYNKALEVNRAIISAHAGGGLLGEMMVGEDVALGADELVTVLASPTYTGDDSLQILIYANGTLKETKEIYSMKPFRLRGAYRGVKIEYAIVGNVKVQEVALASSMDELKE